MLPDQQGETNLRLDRKLHPKPINDSHSTSNSKLATNVSNVTRTTERFAINLHVPLLAVEATEPYLTAWLDTISHTFRQI